MSDTRPRVALNGKQINLAQLDTELGGHGLASSATEVVAVAGSPVTTPQLQAAVDAHVADPLWTNEAKVRANAEQALADLRTIRDSTGNLSSAQLSNAVRVLARVSVVLVRLALSKFDIAE